MNISKRGSRQYPKLKGGHHSKLSQEGLHPKCSIGKCTLSRLSKFLNVGMSMFQPIFCTLLRMRRSLTQSNQTMMVRLHLRLKQMDSQLNNHHKFRGYVKSDMKFLKNWECSNVGIQCAQNVHSSLTAHA